MKRLNMTENFDISQVIAGFMRLTSSDLDEQGLLNFTKECIDLGVDTFDHAPVYGSYTCEKIFGDSVLKKEPSLRKKMKLITKTGIVSLAHAETAHYNSSSKYILNEVEQSLQKLSTDYVDLLLVHRPDFLASPEDIAYALEKLIKEGKVLNIGVSNYTPSQMEALQSYLSVPIVTNQVEISVKYVDVFTDGTLDHAFKTRSSLMAWSPVGGGSVFSGDDEQSTRLRTALQKLADKYNTTIDAIMYAWLFTHPINMSAVAGTMNIDRIKVAVEATKITLTYEEWYYILEASRGYRVP